ncbi:MAG: PBP1A family penicillin-binding protein [Chloroflexi bacterium]|nr:PBP1A family penicillin-binding protein [Chloroflexota bacterium]
METAAEETVAKLGDKGNGGGHDWLTQRKLRRARAHLLARTRFADASNTRLTAATVKFVVAFSVMLSFLLPITSLAAGLGTYAYYTRDFPSPEKLTERQSPRSTFYYDRDGNQLYESFDPEVGRHMLVSLADLPSYVIDATLAVEDPNFYDNPGFDPRSIARAFWQNFQQGGIVSGASTITQQLVRYTMFDEKQRYEQSYSRKIREALLAFQVSQWYSKDEILQRYLNEIWYGNLSYGIDAASWTYFGKHARELTLAESAFLVGLPQAPNTYDPYVNFKAAKARQTYVLDRMELHGYISVQEAEEAKAAPLNFVSPSTDIKSPHFVYYVRGQLEQMLGRDRVNQGGLRVYTTLDSRLQQIGEETAAAHIATIKDRNANNAALVAMDPRTGEVLAMVGSVDYWDTSIQGQVNVAVAERQPGSTLKPFTYATAFEQLGWSPATVLIDQPTNFPGGQGMPPYSPKNHDLRFRGPVTVRNALAPSLNVPAVLTLQAIGVPALLQTLHRMGITSLPSDKYWGLSITLGGGEVKLLDLVFAYQGFANGGKQVGAPVPPQRQVAGMREYEPVSILRVTDEMGNVLYEYQPPEGKEVVSPQIAFQITDIISDDVARSPTYGLHSFLDIGRPAAAKTGTTDDYRDGWTVGFTPQLLAGVWVGNSDGSPMKDVYGVSGAGYIWGNFMKKALEDVPAVSFSRPDGLVRVKTCKITGLLASDSDPFMVEDWHIAGKEPTEYCYLHRDQFTIQPTPGPQPARTPTPTPVQPGGQNPRR